jgi:uncharacterized protein (TIGR03435 family)
MTRSIAVAAFLALLVTNGSSQQTTEAPDFEVASITPCKPGTPAPPGEHNATVQFTFPGGRFTARATTVKYLLEWAYGIIPSQHSDGPSWLADDRYDIEAKAPVENATDDEMKLMIRALLAERFHLKIHHEMRDAPVLILASGKTAPKLFPPKPEEKYSLKLTPLTGDGQKIVAYHVVATRFSFAQVNRTFSRLLDRVIVNQTGLDGDFDFTFDLAPDENRPNPLDPSLLISAMHEQLGFTVRSTKGPVDFFVIDNVEKVAAGN